VDVRSVLQDEGKKPVERKRCSKENFVAPLKVKAIKFLLKHPHLQNPKSQLRIISNSPSSPGKAESGLKHFLKRKLKTWFGRSPE